MSKYRNAIYLEGPDLSEVQSRLQATYWSCLDGQRTLERGDAIGWGPDGYDAIANSIARVATLLGITLEEPDHEEGDEEDDPDAWPRQLDCLLCGRDYWLQEHEQFIEGHGRCPACRERKLLK